MGIRLAAVALVVVAVALLPLPAFARPQATPPKPDHVVIVIEENHAYSQIIGSASAPYINSLAGQGALFTQSFAVTHPSQPNYLHLFSGSAQGTTDDTCPPPGSPYSTANLGGELLAKGFTFGGYSENLPAAGSTACSSGTSDGYQRKHNPWVDFTSVPSSDNLPWSSFPGSASFSSLPTVSVVVPNQADDMHNGTIAQADTWLQSNIDAYAQWAKTHNSLLIVTFDEDDGSEGNRVATIFVGPMVKAGTYSEHITHHNVLRTVEDMYGLTHAGNAANVTSITDCWTSAVNTPPAVSITSPANNASFVAPATITLGATATDSDGTVTKVEFFNGSTSLGSDTTSPYGATWSSVPAGSYTLTAKATDNGGAVTTSAAVHVTVSSPGGSLPSPWLDADVGTVGSAGSGAISGGTYTVVGAGADIWGTADGLNFLYQPLHGDGEIVARVSGLGNTNAWAKAGVMIRESLSAGSAQAMTVITPGNGVSFQRRTSTGGASTGDTMAGPAVPYWVRLVRSGSTFTGYGSADGMSWTQIGTDTIPMAANVLIGFAVTSHADPTTTTATFDSAAGGGGWSAPAPVAGGPSSSSGSSGGGGGGGGGCGLVGLEALLAAAVTFLRRRIVTRRA